MVEKKKPLPATAEMGRDESEEPGALPQPGVVVAFAGGKPACLPIPLTDGRIELGRELVDDDAVSRAHAEVAFDGKRWSVRDLKSRNGTFVDGEKITERVSPTAPLVRLGRAILVALPDVTPFEKGIEQTKTTLIGPTLRQAYDAIAVAARFGSTLHLVGESGSGKELAAAHFHASGSHAAGRFVAVNCATIPEGVAERLLFGAMRGAFSGADATVDGYVQTADGGTLFLDEVAELEPAVQAKLLRVLETKEVLALGASKPRKVDFALCSATHRDLRAAVADGHFREDLFFRLGRPDVHVPPLRDRREEIPWHLARAAEELPIDAVLVEACMLRHWPGNVRELVAEVRFAAQKAIAANRPSVTADMLARDAGTAIRPVTAPSRTEGQPERSAIESALKEHEGNVTAAARVLGMHRNQLRRWLTKEGVDPSSFARHDGDSGPSDE